MTITHQEWESASAWEKNWWQSPACSPAAELYKQDRMARIMNLPHSMSNTAVIDIGCGPMSMLLRMPTDYSRSAALDPIDYSYIDRERDYAKLGIRRLIKKGEDLSSADGHWDVALIYNCLQHVMCPTTILNNAMDVANKLVLFEWCNNGISDGHPHNLTRELIESAVGNKGGWAFAFRVEGEFCEWQMFGKFYAAEFVRQKPVH